MKNFKDITVAVAGTGYVGLSIATLLSQHHHVTAVDVIPEKVIRFLQSRTITSKSIWLRIHIMVKPSDALVINTASAPFFHKMRLLTPK